GNDEQPDRQMGQLLPVRPRRRQRLPRHALPPAPIGPSPPSCRQQLSETAVRGVLAVWVRACEGRLVQTHATGSPGASGPRKRSGDMNEQLVPGTVLRGSRVVSGDIRPNPQWTTGRICGQPGCSTILSIYNREGLC